MRSVQRYLLLIVIIAYLLLGILYSSTVPLFEAPDERQHYGYVWYLASEGRLPPRGEDSLAGHEASQPPFFYAAAALGTVWRSHDIMPETLPNRFYHTYQAPGTANDNKNVFLHSDNERFPWHGAVLTVHITRFINLLFGGLTVFATYLLAREIFPRLRYLAVASAATVAFLPQFIFISSAVNNDIAASALSTLTLWLLVRGVHRGYSLTRATLLGATVGLAALSKVSALALLPLALLVVALRVWLRTTELRLSRRLARVTGRCLVILVAASLVGGWWYFRNSVLYQDPFGLQTHFDAWWRYEEPLSLVSLWSQLPGVGLSLWAAFGMGNVHLPRVTYVLAGCLAFLSMVGLAAWALRAWRSGTSPGPRAWSLSVLALWVGGVFVALLRWMQLVKAALGRLLFPAAGAMAVLMIWGLAQFTSFALRRLSDDSAPRMRIVATVLTGMIAICFCVAAAVPFLAIGPAYARPVLLSQEEIAAGTHPAEIRFGNAIRLMGYQLDKRSAHPGEEISVTLCWRGVASMKKEYAYFIHLLGAGNTIVGARDTHPGLGRFPTSQWVPGDAFCDFIRVPVSSQAPSQAVYDVEVGWYDPEADRRLQAYGPEGNPIDLVLLDQVKITPRKAPELAIPHSVNANLGNRITLLGYGLSEPLIQRSDLLTVTLYWEAQTSVEPDYTVFVHLAAGAAPPDVQHDSQPRNGSYPTSVWEAGEVVVDQHVLGIPESLPAGKYRLLAGMYLLDTGERLMWLAPDGTERGDSVPLRTVVAPQKEP